MASQAGTIWADSATPGSGRAPVVARTSVTRVDPVYVAEVPGAVIVADRAIWAAWTASRLDAHDPLHVAALLNPGFPLGSATPFSGVSALTRSTTLHLLNGDLTRLPNPVGAAGPRCACSRLTGPAADAWRGARAVADGLVAAVAHLADAGQPVELSLTGGKDSRLIAAALVAAGVPVVARTHGFADHPDVVVAAEIARRLGIEHLVRTPAAPGQQVDVLGRIRATVLVADGMLSAFENVGRPDPAASSVITAGGHGGELLRGGYAETAAGRPGAAGGLRAALAPARRAARSAELLRRLTSKHLGLIRTGPAAGYVASLAPWSAAVARHPLHALDDFYLVNRAGRWSAAARQAYLIREHLVQPLFDDRVVLAARAVPLADRISGALSAAVLAELCPALTDVPLAGKPPKAAARRRAGPVRLAPPVRRGDRRPAARLHLRPRRPGGPVRGGEPLGGGEAPHPAALRPRHRLGPGHPRLPALGRLPPRPQPRPAGQRLLTAPRAPVPAGRAPRASCCYPARYRSRLRHRPSPAAGRTIVDRCVHPDVHNDPLSCRDQATAALLAVISCLGHQTRAGGGGGRGRGGISLGRRGLRPARRRRCRGGR